MSVLMLSTAIGLLDDRRTAQRCPLKLRERRHVAPAGPVRLSVRAHRALLHGKKPKTVSYARYALSAVFKLDTPMYRNARHGAIPFFDRCGEFEFRSFSDHFMGSN